MINLKQLEQAYIMQQEGKTKTQISKELKVNRTELIHKLEIFKEIKDKFNKQLEGIKSKIITADEAENIKSSRIKKREEELQELDNKLLEREAWMKLFVKNIIYKYKDKDKNLKQQMQRYKEEMDKENKDIKEENFALYFDLQKEVREKLDAQQDLQNYKFYVKFRYIIIYFIGATSTVIFLIIREKWDVIMGFISKIIS